MEGKRGFANTNFKLITLILIAFSVLYLKFSTIIFGGFLHLFQEFLLGKNAWLLNGVIFISCNEVQIPSDLAFLIVF